MRINSRQQRWALGLFLVALLPVGMTIAVVAAFAKAKPAPPAPRVVAGWAAGPMEARIAFDQPVDPVVATRAVGRVIRFAATSTQPEGEGRPGGDGGTLRVASARLIDEGRTLVLGTDPHPREATYAILLDPIQPPGALEAGRSLVVSYSLAGVEATWTPEGGTEPTWSGWWPDLNPAVVRATLAGSSDHDRLGPLLKQPGKLALRSFVTLPPAPVTVTVAGTTPFEVTFGAATTRADGNHRASFEAELTAEPVELTASLTTIAGGPEPTLTWTMMTTGTNPQARTLSPSALSVAWAPPPLPGSAAPTIPEPLATGGDPTRGAVVFASEQAKCVNCHQVRGQGGQVGPDLSSLVGVSRAWVYQNIVEPSASIHPDFVSYTVALKDGRIGMGVVRAEGGDALRVGDIDAKFTTFPRAEVEELRPSSSSIMPVGLIGALGDDKTRDLLAFLTTPHTISAPVPSPSAP